MYYCVYHKLKNIHHLKQIHAIQKFVKNITQNSTWMQFDYKTILNAFLKIFPLT